MKRLIYTALFASCIIFGACSKDKVDVDTEDQDLVVLPDDNGVRSFSVSFSDDNIYESFWGEDSKISLCRINKDGDFAGETYPCTFASGTDEAKQAMFKVDNDRSIPQGSYVAVYAPDDSCVKYPSYQGNIEVNLPNNPQTNENLDEFAAKVVQVSSSVELSDTGDNLFTIAPVVKVVEVAVTLEDKSAVQSASSIEIKAEDEVFANSISIDKSGVITPQGQRSNIYFNINDSVNIDVTFGYTIRSLAYFEGEHTVDLTITTKDSSSIKYMSQVEDALLASTMINKLSLEVAEDAAIYTAKPDIDGTTITISRGDQFEWLALATAAGVEPYDGTAWDGFEGYDVVLSSDVNLNGQLWNPIGGAESPFRGCFDGCGHTISNAQFGSGDNRGLFGMCQGSVIENVTLADVTMSMDKNCGFFAGAAENVEFSNCHLVNVEFLPSTNSEDSKIGAGGFVGLVDGAAVYDSSIKFITNDAKCDKGSIGGLFGYNVVGSAISVDGFELDNLLLYSNAENVGGVIGYFEGAVDDNATFATLKVVDATLRDIAFERKSSYTGGVAGRCYRSTIDVDDCNISNITINSTGGGNSAVIGGATGYKGVGESGPITFDGCEVDNMSIMTSSSNNAGALVGFVCYDVAATNCKVSNSNIIAKFGVGGLIGNTALDICTPKHTINNCSVSSSTLTATASHASLGVGGIASATYTGSVISDCSVSNSKIAAEYSNSAGGIASYVTGTIIKGCLSDSNQITINTGLGNSHIGGIVGKIMPGGKTLIAGCENRSDIVVPVLAATPVRQARVGGIVGLTACENALITGCINLGDLTNPTNDSLYTATGGLVGRASVKTNIVGCYNRGKLLTPEPGLASNAGLLVGSYVGGTLLDCYYDASEDGAIVALGTISTAEATDGGQFEAGVCWPNGSDEGFGVVPALWDVAYGMWVSPWGKIVDGEYPQISNMPPIDTSIGDLTGGEFEGDYDYTPAQ